MARVLMIDDDIDALRILKTILVGEGYEVDMIAKWHETFDRIKEFKPNLILLDVLLYGIDGRHICQQLKNSKETKDIPVILITASPDIVKNIGTSGANDFLEKPFTKEDLIKKINMQLAFHAQKQP